MKVQILLIAIALAIAVPVIPTAANAGPCDHSWQRAKDGSSCGNRAADKREGGSDGD